MASEDQWETATTGRNRRKAKREEKALQSQQIKGYSKANEDEEGLSIHDLPPEVHAHLFTFFNARELLYPIPLVCSYWQEESKLQRISRMHEFKVVEEFNVFRKPGYLTWQQFHSELSSFHLTLKFPTDSSRFTLTSHPSSSSSSSSPQQQQKSQQPQQPQQRGSSQRQQPQQPQQPQQSQQGKGRKRRGRNRKKEQEEDEDEDEELLLRLSKQHQQQKPKLQPQQQQQPQQQKKKEAQQPQQPQHPQPQPQPQQTEGKKIVDVALTHHSDGISDLVRAAFDLAFLKEHSITTIAPDRGRVYMFFDLTREREKTAEKEKEKEREEEEKFKLFVLHRDMMDDAIVKGRIKTERPEQQEKDRNLKKGQRIQDQGYLHKVTVQVLVDAKDLFRGKGKEFNLDEEEVEKMKAGMREVTVARVSLLCWVYHLCRAIDTMMLGKTKDDYLRHRQGQWYGFPWQELEWLKQYIPFFDPRKVVWDYPDEEEMDDINSYLGSYKRRGIKKNLEEWDAVVQYFW